MKIRNSIVLVTLIIGLLFGAVHGRLFNQSLGMFFGLVLYPLFMFRLLGAGDVKILCAIGAWIGLLGNFYLIIIVIIMNGFVALFYMIFSKNNVQLSKQFLIWIKTCYYAKAFLPPIRDIHGKNEFPYMIGVFLGILYYKFLF